MWNLFPNGKPQSFSPLNGKAMRHEIDPEILTFSDVSLEAMPIYEPYYRKYGIIRAVQLAAPKLQKLEALELPAQSILHYLPEAENELGPSTDHTVLKNYRRIIMMQHVTELGDNRGNPRPMPIPSGTLKRDYRRQNLRVREMDKPEMVMRDPQMLAVINYSLLGHLYRYPVNYFRSYYKWWNVQAAVWKRVGELGKEFPRRNQFLMCNVPQMLPTLANLLRGERETEMPRNLLPRFNTPEAMFVLEVWKWLGAEYRGNSVLAYATPEQLAKMHLIFIEGDRWITLNLGLLDQWRKRPESEGGNDKHRGPIDPIMLQKRFLRLLMALTEIRSGGDAEAPMAEMFEGVEVQVQTQADGTQDIASAMPVERAEPVKLEVPNENGGSNKVKLTAHLNLDRFPADLIEETPDNIRLIDQAITKDLEALDHMAAKYEAQLIEGEEDSPIDLASTEVSAMIAYTPDERSLPQGVMNKVDQQADAHLLSGAEYRRFTALSTAYQRLPNPFGEGTIEDMLTLDPADLKLPTEPRVPDLVTVPDKSMLKSSIKHFDEQYLEKVYYKDITRMVLAMQNAGIAITGFEAAEYQDALNHYEKFSVQLTPVVGRVSTVNFKLPKVRKDGTYTDNGSRYRLRKQRGD